MKKRIALIFGDRGGIGSATRRLLLDHGFRIIPVNSAILDFNKSNADKEILSLLKNAEADVIINCAGVFENGWQQDHTKTMNVNFGSNWSIVRYFLNPENQSRTTRVIMIGSSSYIRGRKLYPLYSASKAALYNLWQGAQEALDGTAIRLDLINPARTLTKMASERKEVDPTLKYLKPEQVAEQIYQLVDENQPSRCIDMTFEDTK
jgi:ribitol-5-phosphate 2-dehydrogenase (NADP+) / D-ribitol-5-phosphate cytidylyltransferase